MAQCEFGAKIGVVRVGGVNLDVYSNGRCNHISDRRAFDADGHYLGMQYQSVELVRRFIYQKYGVNVARFWAGGEALDWWRYAARMGFSKIEIDKIQEGDILVWRGAEYGHLSVANKVEAHRFSTISQNLMNDEQDLSTWVSLEDEAYQMIDAFNRCYTLVGGLRLTWI